MSATESSRFERTTRRDKSPGGKQLRFRQKRMSTITYHDDNALWTELLPGGHHWSGRIQRGTVLQFKALGAQANVSLFCVNSEDKLDRFNMPDSLKAQHRSGWG